MESCVVLNNGVNMPRIGYGTYRTPPGITERCVADAFSVGYRHIDTAQCYGNEREVGKAIKNSGLSRDEVFVTTKLWACRGYNDTVHAINGSLSALNLGHIDLLLIHEPTGDVHEIYRAMEDAYKGGKLRAIGLSNFLEDRYQDLVNNCSLIPAVNQVETHVFRQQKTLRNLEMKYGTQAESWSPMACGENGIFTNTTLKKIAESHEKTAAQIALRFLYQLDIVIIPKSTHIERMKENLDILDFELTHVEIKKIETLEIGKSMFGWW